MKNQDDRQFNFQFSLEILNLLGRGLYRSFATVIAEAVSNSWDAEATEVEITITDKGFIVEDNGKGMNDVDFQEKFLTVGYSRRLDKGNLSKRSVIGRKGIGKLAMLSISEEVTILSKKDTEDITGGKINNPQLDKKIKAQGKYNLESLSKNEKTRLFSKNKKSGTKIIFEKLKTNSNSESIIRKYLATQFNFIFSLNKNDSFKIIVNNTPITQEDLKELDDNTQFVWFLDNESEKRKNRYKNLIKSKLIKNTSFEFKKEKISVKGFIASVKEPKNLLLRGSGGDFRASINLFSNGRLRQENLFQEITSKRITEEYLYGEIHVDGFESEEIDRFTSSREGIIKDDPLYQIFLKELRKIQNIILTDWSVWRRENKDEGDIEDGTIPKYQKRLEDSQNWREKDFKNKIEENIEDQNTKENLIDKLKSLSSKNTEIYQDLFILENIFREYIKIKGIKETDIDANSNLGKELKKIKGYREQGEERHALKGKITQSNHYLNYYDIIYLSILIDDLISNVNKLEKRYQMELSADAKDIYPIRNVIMHTNEITEDVMKWDKIKNVIDYIDKLKEKR